MKSSRIWHRWSLSLLIMLCGISCGDIETGGSGIVNDPAPSGSPVASGSFVSSATQTVTGVAAVYQTNGVVILRLQGLSAPSHVGLQVYIDSNFIGPLRNSSGNLNYETQLPSAFGLSQVRIENPALPAGSRIYGTAILQAATPTPPSSSVR